MTWHPEEFDCDLQVRVVCRLIPFSRIFWRTSAEQQGKLFSNAPL